MSQILIIDNGACSLKAGYSTDQAPLVVPNAVIKAKNERKRVFIGPEIDECKDRTSLFYLTPFQRGYLVNWDTEHQIWDRIFAADKLNVAFGDCKLVLTDPNYCVPAIRDISDEIIFEDYCFQAVLKTSSALCAGYPNLQTNKFTNDFCNLVVDTGYSFTHVVPVANGSVIQSGVKRINVGGKQLTNQLKEWVSYRQMNMLEETYLINECKEKCCFVASDFDAEMRKMSSNATKKAIVREYVLPDYVTTDVGVMQTPSACGGVVNPDLASLQRILMGTERFCIPELLFRPSDVGIQGMGIAEAIALSIDSIPEALRGRMLKNIVVVGGNALFPGFRERLEQELRSLVESKYETAIRLSSNPVTHVWHSAAAMIAANGENNDFVTREEYHEHGPDLCRKRFYKFSPN
ncbi:hypothetical protein QR680_005573 [Steinernema hermaphroditum]|uniref:Actin-related protein 6 n=1 Tax=Steinernema hermaphroditum TaxID=289476 RepID=A0AA39LV43_9BILA|nr:hypothetical protein QR680_005573 [Steinernema hermaphroditum]